MEEKKSFTVREKRKKGWFWLDNEYLNGYGRIFGPVGVAIYVCLCRHCDEEQKCYPAEKTIAKELNISDRTVRKYLKLFKKYRLIEITRERSKDGKFLNNTYWLLDKSEWIKPAEIISDGKPAENNDIASGNKCRRHQIPPKEDPLINNNKEDPLNKNIILHSKQKFAGREINEIISLFKEINPSYEKFYSNKTQRAAVERLLKKWGREKLEKIIKLVKKTNKMPYAPTITSPLELENKLAKLIAFVHKERSKPPLVIEI